jgi:phospholipase/carboxylesterase
VIIRRRFVALATPVLAALIFGGACRNEDQQLETNDGRLAARPNATSAKPIPGQSNLEVDPARDAILLIPKKLEGGPIPLLVLLHGAGGRAEAVLSRMGSAPDETGVAVLAVNSRYHTWDAIRHDFGPDVTFLNRALEKVFERIPVDKERIAIGGFSDGATYALSLGLINGDLFNRVVAFSPGFVVEGATHGKPRFFISHGTSDTILPIDRCSRRIVSDLRKAGYEITLREFDGGHTVPADIALEGLRWVAER